MSQNPSNPGSDESLFDALVGFAVDGIMAIDEKGIVRVYNKACEHLFGYEAAEVIGQNVKMLMPAPYRDSHDNFLDRYVRTREKHIIGIGREVSGRRKDGSTFPINLSVGEGVVRGERIFLGIITDITERQQRNRQIQELQSEMAHVSRLTAMGQVSASLAHELNQPLTAILNYANACIDIAAAYDDPDLKNALNKVAEQATRAGNIIRHLRAFTEKRGTVRAPEDLARVVDEAVRLGQINAAERGIALRVRIERDLPQVMIDRIQIQQVLINLIKNAAEAMEKSPRKRLTVSLEVAGSDRVRVAISDTGSGISADAREKLFQAFVTTKDKGMGMGLNICRGIVEAHGGRLWLEKSSGEGTTFAFEVPIAVDAARDE